MQALPDHARDEIRRALLEGRKIEAVRLYREQTGAGLMDAKLAIENIAGVHMPQQTNVVRPGRLTSHNLLAFLIIAAAILTLLLLVFI